MDRLNPFRTYGSSNDYVPPPPPKDDISYIMYTCIAYEGVILAQRQSPLKHKSEALHQDINRAQDNVGKVLKKIIKRDETNEKKTLLCKRFNYHYVCDKGTVWLCATPTHHPQSLAFSYLREVKREWSKRYTSFDCARAMPEQMTVEFKSVLTSKMMYYSDQTTTRVAEVMEQVDEVKDIAYKNIERVTKRGEALEMVEFKASEIAEMGGAFKKVTKKLKKKKWHQNIRVQICYYFLCCVLLIMVFYLVGALVCRGWGWPRCINWVKSW
eukprot:TRINITY_DN7855_c2_g1_i1.p1 TRINITY_DN7855_c2_g1~~TRINITY_DN7855_c2_g1_i1.p1  ORF type:complete len:269 (+),score=41.74 TRINITY_DN7855_c2_g1_i1:128-934(+)